MDVNVDRPLPDPRAEEPLTAAGALERAERAAWRTRRLLDASRNPHGDDHLRMLLTGGGDDRLGRHCRRRSRPHPGMSGDHCLLDLDAGLGVLADSPAISGGIKVVDRFEANLSSGRKNFFWRFLPAYAFALGETAMWSILFKVMPGSEVVLTMWLVTAIMAGLFVGRFVLFQFWEDLVFAASVAMAWSLYLLQDRRLAALAIVPLLAVVVATACLDRRWRVWVRDLRVADAETEGR